MKVIIAILMGLFSGFLIYMMAAMVFFAISKDESPSSLLVFFSITFLGGWILSSYIIRRGAKTLSKVFSRGFLIGAAEWLSMIPVGLIFAGKAISETTATPEAVIGGGLIALFTGGVSIFMAIVCLIGFAVSYFIGREMKPEASIPTKKCPECAELVQAEAKKCRYCGANLSVVMSPDLAARTQSVPSPGSIRNSSKVVVAQNLLNYGDYIILERIHRGVKRLGLSRNAFLIIGGGIVMSLVLVIIVMTGKFETLLQDVIALKGGAARPSAPVIPSAPAEGPIQNLELSSPPPPQEDSGRMPRKDNFTSSFTFPGYTTYTNGRFGFKINYPQSFVSNRPPDNGDGIELKSPDGQALLTVSGGNNPDMSLQDYYDAEVEKFLEKFKAEPEYKVIKDNWFVISWKVKGNIAYLKMFVGSRSHNMFLFIYPENKKAVYDEVTINLEKSFRPGDIDRAW